MQRPYFLEGIKRVLIIIIIITNVLLLVLLLHWNRFILWLTFCSSISVVQFLVNHDGVTLRGAVVHASRLEKRNDSSFTRQNKFHSMTNMIILSAILSQLVGVKNTLQNDLHGRHVCVCVCS